MLLPASCRVARLRARRSWSAPSKCTATGCPERVSSSAKVVRILRSSDSARDLTSWDNYYVLPSRLDDLTGQYQEELAEFAPDGDAIMSVDGDGRIFFQSAHSACTGNGTLAPPPRRVVQCLRRHPYRR